MGPLLWAALFGCLVGTLAIGLSGTLVWALPGVAVALTLGWVAVQVLRAAWHEIRVVSTVRSEFLAYLERVEDWMCEAWLAAGQVGRALATWNGSLKGGPEDAAVLRRLARLSADIGDYVDLQERLEKIVADGWAGVEDRLLFARILARVRMNPGAALQILDDGLKDAALSPVDRARLLTEKVAVAVSASTAGAESAEVSQWLDTARDLAPDLPELLYVAGLADEKSGAIETAITSFEAAAELAPDRPEVAMRLALLMKDDPKAALQVADSAAREAARYVPIHLAKAALALGAGDTTTAMAAIRRARDFDPERYGKDHLLDAFLDPAAAHLTVVRLLTQRGRRSDNAMITTAVAMAYYFADDLKRSEAALTRAIKTDPEDIGARLYRAVIALKHKRVAVAKKDLHLPHEFGPALLHRHKRERRRRGLAKHQLSLYGP